MCERKRDSNKTTVQSGVCKKECYFLLEQGRTRSGENVKGEGQRKLKTNATQ